MAWESRTGKGRYYTRSRRINGRVVREYYGMGTRAHEAAERDRIQRQNRLAARAELAQRKVLNADANRALNQVERICSLYVSIIMETAGFRLYRKTEWRRHRDQ